MRNQPGSRSPNKFRSPGKAAGWQQYPASQARASRTNLPVAQGKNDEIRPAITKFDSPTALFKIKARVVQNPDDAQQNDRMPRLNMIRIRADHAAANEMRNNVLKSTKQANNVEPVIESKSFMINDKEQLRSSFKKGSAHDSVLNTLQNSNKKLLAPMAAAKKGPDAKNMINSYFGSTECTSGQTSGARRNIEVCNVDSDDECSSDSESPRGDREFLNKQVRNSIFS